MDFLLRGARQRVLEGGQDLRELRHPQELLVGVRHVGVHARLPLHKVLRDRSALLRKAVFSAKK